MFCPSLCIFVNFKCLFAVFACLCVSLCVFARLYPSLRVFVCLCVVWVLLRYLDRPILTVKNAVFGNRNCSLDINQCAGGCHLPGVILTIQNNRNLFSVKNRQLYPFYKKISKSLTKINQCLTFWRLTIILPRFFVLKMMSAYYDCCIYSKCPTEYFGY